MLATIAALQLLVLSQVGPPPKEVTPDEPATQEGAPPAGEQNPALPGKPPPRSGTIPAPPSSSRSPSTSPATTGAPARARQLSLLSAEPLQGASTAMAWAGWRSLGIAYAQGITPQDDLGGFLDFDWSTTELRIGAMYRRPLGQAGVFDMAGRLAAAWYHDSGATWIEGKGNHADRGVEFVPGLSLSNRVSGGVFSILAEAPLTITMRGDSGLLFSPRLSLAYEAPLYPEVTVGAQLGIGYRAGSGDAPLKEGSAFFTFLVVATYQLL